MLSSWIDIVLASGYRNISIVPAAVAEPGTYFESDVPKGCPLDFVVYGCGEQGHEAIGLISGVTFYWTMPF